MKYAINLQQVSFKTLTMANTCFASLPSSIFNPKSPSPSPSLSIHSKSIKFPSLSLQKGRLNRSIVLSVAQTSDWAHQDEQEGSNAVLEGLEQGADQPELNWNAEDFGAVEGQVSDWEARGGEEAVEGGEGEEEGGFVEPPEEAKLFVGNLPYDVDSERLAQVFEQAGIVEIAEVIYNRETDQSRGFGFVTMSTVEEAEKAVGMFNRYDLNGRTLTVNKAAPRGSRPERPPREFEPSFRVYVGNLPWDVDNARLEQVFSEHGKVVSARVVYDRESGRSRGFGFVTMSSETEMNDAISALDGQTLDGRAIRVNMAEDRPRRSF